MRGLGAQRGGFGLGHRGLGCFGSGGERRQIGALRALDLRELRRDGGDLVGQAGDPVAVLARGRFQGMAPRRQVGKRAGQFIRGLFRCREHGVRFGDPLVHARAPGFVGAGFALQRLFFARESGQRRLRVRRQAPFALDIGAELDQAAIEFGHALPGARFLALERLARRGQPMQGGGGLGLRLAHGRQVGGRECLALGRLGLLAGTLGDHALGRILGVFGFGKLGIGGDQRR